MFRNFKQTATCFSRTLLFALQWRRAFAGPADHVRTVRVEREAHGGAAVTALSASAGGNLLLSAGADGCICLWDLSPCCTPGSGGGSAPLRPRLLARGQHPSPVVWAQLLAPDSALSATATAAFVWRIERPEWPGVGAAGAGAAGAAGATGGASSSSGSAPQPAFRLLRRFSAESGVTCAAAWDQFLAVGCGERPSCSDLPGAWFRP